MFLYSLYIIPTLIITLYVGHLLHKDGKILLQHLISNGHLADRINDTLLLGYYLVNMGYILFAIGFWGNPEEPFLKVLENIGTILLILALLHYQNIACLYLFFKFKLSEKWKL